MRSKHALSYVLICVSLTLSACGSTLAESAATSTPTLEKQPTPTPTATTPPEIVPSETAAPLPVPSPFDISMQFTNGSCGAGAPIWDYTFTIEGTSITQVQTDGIGGPVVVTLTGAYDPASGAFSTTADVGTGIENYDGTISFDGATITVTGGYAYTPTGGAACAFDFEGTTTP